MPSAVHHQQYFIFTRDCTRWKLKAETEGGFTVSPALKLSDDNSFGSDFTDSLQLGKAASTRRGRRGRLHLSHRLLVTVFFFLCQRLLRQGQGNDERPSYAREIVWIMHAHRTFSGEEYLVFEMKRNFSSDLFCRVVNLVANVLYYVYVISDERKG